MVSTLENYHESFLGYPDPCISRSMAVDLGLASSSSSSSSSSSRVVPVVIVARLGMPAKLQMQIPASQGEGLDE